MIVYLRPPSSESPRIFHVLFFPMHAACPSHLICADLIRLTVSGREYTFWSFSLIITKTTIDSIHPELNYISMSQRPSYHRTLCILCRSRIIALICVCWSLGLVWYNCSPRGGTSVVTIVYETNCFALHCNSRNHEATEFKDLSRAHCFYVNITSYQCLPTERPPSHDVKLDRWNMWAMCDGWGAEW
jgi:hypothetical protein